MRLRVVTEEGRTLADGQACASIVLAIVPGSRVSAKRALWVVVGKEVRGGAVVAVVRPAPATRKAGE